MPKLTLSLPDGTDQSHELTDDVITIGRIEENNLQISDPSVSSYHAQLTAKGGEYELEDLNSTNGTRVNGETLKGSILLKIGDRVRFGKIEAYFGDEREEVRPLPRQEAVSVTPAAKSHRPTDFANASPFKTKGKKKDPVGNAILGFSIFSIVVFAAAVTMIFMLQAPQ